MRWPALLLRKTVAEYLDMSEAAQVNRKKMGRAAILKWEKRA